MKYFDFFYKFEISASSKILTAILSIDVKNVSASGFELTHPNIGHWIYRLHADCPEINILNSIPIFNVDSFDMLKECQLSVIDTDSNTLICNIELKRCC